MPTRSPDIQIRVHRRFEDIEPRWRDLTREAETIAFQTAEWVKGIVETILPEGAAEPLFVELADGATGDTLAILPLCRARRAGLTVLQWLDGGVVDCAAPLVAPAFRPGPRVGRRLWLDILAALPPCDLVWIQKIPDHVAGRANLVLTLPGLLAPIAYGRLEK